MRNQDILWILRSEEQQRNVHRVYMGSGSSEWQIPFCISVFLSLDASCSSQSTFYDFYLINFLCQSLDAVVSDSQSSFFHLFPVSCICSWFHCPADPSPLPPLSGPCLNILLFYCCVFVAGVSPALVPRENEKEE